MTHSMLDYFLIGQLSAFLLIVCRLGSAFLSMPGFSETYVSPRIRLIFAISLSVLITPVLQPRMPALPGNPFALFILMGGEILVGLFMGILMRALLSVMHTAGNMIATQSSLAVAAAFDPTSANQSAILGNLMGIMALTMFFALNLHHLMIAAVVQSYDVFSPGASASVQDMSTLYTRWMADCFRLGIILSAPHMAYSLLFYLAGGLMSRLMPNFQIFFVMIPLQILIGLFLFYAILPTAMEMFAQFANDHLLTFVKGDL